MTDVMEDLVKKYKEKLKQNLKTKTSQESDDDYNKEYKPVTTRDYEVFKKENLSTNLSIYEKVCNISEKLLKLTPSKAKADKLQEAIDACHLNITPTGTASFAVLGPLLFILFGAMIAIGIFGSLLFVLLFLIIGLIIIVPLQNYPFFLANTWRMKASNQMVLCTFYIVTYMRHTSNLELAINFAADRIAPPLSLDLKKVLWDVEIENFETVKESLEYYLEQWKDYNPEFIESFHLIISSLYEPTEQRRLELLDKSLDVILDETYEKMLHYAQNLKNPITMLHMIGIILPILSLVILPIVVSLMKGFNWYILLMLYNIILPIPVYLLGKSILSKRPTGYGETDITAINPEFKKFQNIVIGEGKKQIIISPLAFCIIIFIILFILGLLPFILHATLYPGVHEPKTFEASLLGFRYSSAPEAADKIIGPFGIGSSILSMFITLAFGIPLGMYYTIKSKKLMIIRENTKKLELEFSSAIFQLGNRIGDGFPAEIAFSKVADTMENTASGSFFSLVSQNIVRLGMSVKEAIFNPKNGAIKSFPSSLIESSMKVLVESIKKGPKVAAQAMASVSNYVKQMHRVEERLKDLMAEVISSMKSQISFLAPGIAAVVIGITSMITNILGQLSTQVKQISSESAEAGAATSPITSMFGDGLPTYFFQIVVGLYVVQIIYILTVLENGIENGADSLSEKNMLGRNLIRGTMIYVIVGIIIMVLFNMIANVIMSATITS